MRSRPLYTASSAERALACPASQALPIVVEPAGAFAERGTWLHLYLASVGKLGADHALALVPAEYRDACAKIDLRWLPVDPSGYAAEVAFAYDVDRGTAIELGRNLDRNYGELPDGILPLTADVVGLSADRVLVADYKTGHSRVTTAARNRQLQLGALAAARAYKRDAATVLLIYVKDDGDSYAERAEFDGFDLDGFAAEFSAGAAAVRKARDRLAGGGELDVAMGPHCKHCPVINCPGKVALIHAVTSSPATFREAMTGGLSKERARDAVLQWRMASDVVKRIGEAIYAHAAETGGIEMGDGIVFGPVSTTRESVDGSIVRKVLTELHGPDIAERAVSYESTKTAIRDALRKVAQDTGRTLAELERVALAAIGDAGGIDRRTSTTIKDHRPKRMRAAGEET